MAKATFVKEAKKPIYLHGKRVEYVSKRGKRVGQTLSKIDRNQPQDENDTIIINVGESYYTWCFYGGQPQYSKTAPKQSQLTQNWFKTELYSIQEEIEEYENQDPEDIANLVESVTESIESLRDECQEHLDNIPEQLQESDAGQTLQSRIDALDEALSEFENIDTDFESEIDESERDTMSDEEWEDALEKEKHEWMEDKICEISSVDLDID